MLRGSGCEMKAVAGRRNAVRRAARRFIARDQRSDRGCRWTMCLDTLLAALMEAV